MAVARAASEAPGHVAARRRWLKGAAGLQETGLAMDRRRYTVRSATHRVSRASRQQGAGPGGRRRVVRPIRHPLQAPLHRFHRPHGPQVAGLVLPARRLLAPASQGVARSRQRQLVQPGTTCNNIAVGAGCHYLRRPRWAWPGAPHLPGAAARRQNHRAHESDAARWSTHVAPATRRCAPRQPAARQPAPRPRRWPKAETRRSAHRPAPTRPGWRRGCGSGRRGLGSRCRAGAAAHAPAATNGVAIRARRWCRTRHRSRLRHEVEVAREANRLRAGCRRRCRPASLRSDRRRVGAAQRVAHSGQRFEESAFVGVTRRVVDEPRQRLLVSGCRR
jgi:hypothetical protein